MGGPTTTALPVTSIYADASGIYGRSDSGAGGGELLSAAEAREVLDLAENDEVTFGKINLGSDAGFLSVPGEITAFSTDGVTPANVKVRHLETTNTGRVGNLSTGTYTQCSGTTIRQYVSSALKSEVSGTLVNVLTSFKHSGSTLGVFGQTPVTRPQVSATSPTLLQDLLTALDLTGIIEEVA